MIKIIEGNIIFPNQIKYGQVIISGEEIENIILKKNIYHEPDLIVGEGKYISPGFIDLQINGAFGKEFKTDVDALDVISNNIYKFGTTSFCPTITTIELEKYSVHAKKLIENYSKNGQTKFLGFHFEGPLLNPDKAGAQNSSILKLPDDINLDNYLSVFTKIVTLAPELVGSEQLISKLKERHIKIGIGHSLIPFEELAKKFDDKNMMIVHLFNAMLPLTSREPGLVGAGLVNDNYIISVIVDGIHVHPSTCNIIWKSKFNKEKIICISDGSAVTGLKEGTYSIGDRVINKFQDRAMLPNGKLVGSILTLNTAVKNVINFCNSNIYEAVNTVSLNPAKFLGLENEIGQIKIGNKADLVVINSEFEVEKTFINGVLKFDSVN